MGSKKWLFSGKRKSFTHQNEGHNKKQDSRLPDFQNSPKDHIRIEHAYIRM